MVYVWVYVGKRGFTCLYDIGTYIPWLLWFDEGRTLHGLAVAGRMWRFDPGLVQEHGTYRIVGLSGCDVGHSQAGGWNAGLVVRDSGNISIILYHIVMYSRMACLPIFNDF